MTREETIKILKNMKIPFDIKFKPQIESGEYKVFAHEHEEQEARIVCWDNKGKYPIVALVDNEPEKFDKYGRVPGGNRGGEFGLFIVTPEEELSEDGRIREAIESIIRVYGKTQGEWIAGYDMDTLVVHLRDAFAYLERQKEQKPFPAEDEKDFLEKEVKAFLCNYDKEFDDDAPTYDIAEHFYQLGKNSQVPAEWSEEYRKEDLRTRFAFYTYKDEDSVLYLSNVFVEETSRNKGFGTKILQAAEMVAQTIGALTIRLKVKQNTPANDWYRRHGYGYLVFEDGYDWLEKNLEYLKPKQEWSETDKLHLNNAILIAKKEWGVNSYTARFLESLRDNYKKCNCRWKPSEEQINALERAIIKMHTPNDIGILAELRDNLKKL